MALIGAPQEIHIKLYYKEVKMPAGFTKFIIVEDEEAEKIIAEAEKESKPSDIKCLNTYWKILTWEMQNRITEQSGFFNEVTQTPDINVWRYRDLRLRNCLSRWDLVNDEGVAVPVNDGAISMLPGDIILNLLAKYDDAVVLDAEERKN